MNRKRFAVAILFASVLLTLASVPLSQQAIPYDAWADINEDGKIDIKDIAYTAGQFGTTGDPTKNVNVINWPTSQDVLVWWHRNLAGLNTIGSSVNLANGFGHLHVLVHETGLTGSQQVTVYFRAMLLNKTTGVWWPLPFYTVVLTSSNDYAAVTVSVPSEGFYFTATSYDATVNCYIDLSFYLTWS